MGRGIVCQVIEPDDRAFLEFEDTHPRMTAQKMRAIRLDLDLSTTGYFIRLHRLIDDPEVEREYPQLVHRLQRIREIRNRRRADRRIA